MKTSPNTDLDAFQITSLIIIGIFVLYLGIATTVFQFRNPTANSAACITHLGDVMNFRVLPQFQEKP